MPEWLELAAGEACARRRSSCPTCSTTRSARRAHGAVGERPGRSGAGWPSASRAGRSCAAPSTTSTPCGRAGAAEARRALLERLRRADPPRRASCSRARSPRRPGRTARRSSHALETACPTPTSRSWRRRSTTRRKPVRDAAARLLAALPRSRLRRAMAERAKPLLASRPARSSPRSPGRRTRRQSATGSRRAAGARSASRRCSRPTPLDTGTLECRPAVATTSRLRSTTGWAEAARRQRDAAGRARCGGSTTQLLAASPRRGRGARRCRRGPVRGGAARCAGPWGPELSREVVDAIPALAAGSATWTSVRRLPARSGARARGRAAARPRRPRRVELCDVLAVRAAMLRELT